MQVLYAAAGGALGAASRFLISRLPLSGHGLPLPTFLANLIGCFLMGLIAAKAEARGMLGFIPSSEAFFLKKRDQSLNG